MHNGAAPFKKKFRRTIVLVQHLVSSLSLGDCSAHRLREESSRNLCPPEFFWVTVQHTGYERIPLVTCVLLNFFG